MLTRSGPSNTSGKSVTTLIVSIGLFHGHEVVAPRLHHRARVDPDERQQPLAMVSAPPRHDERSEEHTSELQSQSNLVCRLLLEKKKIWEGTAKSATHLPND